MAFLGCYSRLLPIFLMLDRETEFECCSFSFLACDMYFPLMSLDEFVGLQQTDTSSSDTEIDGVVSTEEVFEQLLLVVVGNTDSCISNRKEPMFFIDLYGY